PRRSRSLGVTQWLPLSGGTDHAARMAGLTVPIDLHRKPRTAGALPMAANGVPWQLRGLTWEVREARAAGSAGGLRPGRPFVADPVAHALGAGGAVGPDPPRRRGGGGTAAPGRRHPRLELASGPVACRRAVEGGEPSGAHRHLPGEPRLPRAAALLPGTESPGLPRPGAGKGGERRAGLRDALPEDTGSSWRLPHGGAGSALAPGSLALAAALHRPAARLAAPADLPPCHPLR